MISRLHCWRNGHTWGEITRMAYSDAIGNQWRQQWCDQCGAERRHLAKRWDEG